MTVPDAKRLKALEEENTRMKKSLAETLLEQAVTPRGASTKVVRAPARREVVRWMCGRGLTERCALKVMGMSASSVRYRPAPNRNAELRNAMTTLAARHPRYGGQG